MKNFRQLWFPFLILCVFFSTKLYAQTPDDQIKSSPKKVQAESEPTIGIGICIDDGYDPEEYFWCTVERAVKEKNLSHCKRGIWQHTSSCLMEVKKEFPFTAEDCKTAFEHKYFQESCTALAEKG